MGGKQQGCYGFIQESVKLKKKVLFITSTNLGANPRLLKEMRLMLEQGYEVTGMLFHFNNWSSARDNELRASLKEVRFIQLSALRVPFIPWLFSSLLEKGFRLLPVAVLNHSMLSSAVSKRSYLLIQAIKKMNESFDWVIAHNPATFYPALMASRKFKASLGIDVEDYHPGETNDPKAATIMKKLMQLVLPGAAYCSYASPLIMEEVKKDVKGLKNNQLVILNGFNGDEFIKPIPVEKEAIQLVWFSQNIDVNRGLENVIPVVNELYPLVELHLIGNLKPAFETAYLQNKTGIIIHPSKSQKELHQFLSTCDVGLALEPGKDLNNQLAISNKLIASVQAGLYIFAFDTPAQTNFLKKNDLQCQIIGNEKNLICEALVKLDKNEIRKGRENRFIQGRLFDWHKMAAPLIQVWIKEV